MTNTLLKISTCSLIQWQATCLGDGHIILINASRNIIFRKQCYSNFKSLKCKDTQRGCAMDFVSQKIEIRKAGAKTEGEIGDLVKREWAHVGLDKEQKKD